MTATPYRDAAPLYRAAGWAGVLPLPPVRKGPPPDGWTGHAGGWPSYADTQAWIDGREGDGNLALRLPPDVVGIDVDCYDGKQGAATLAAAVEKWGPLPATWTSTARTDGSGIRLFRVPEGLRWPGQVGAHIEVIQVGHRYMVTAPSAHPDGPLYRWYRPDGALADLDEVPAPDDLPELPDAWTAGLTSGELAEEVSIANLSTPAVQAWILMHHHGNACPAMRAVLVKLLDELRTGSAHEALRRLFGLARLAEQGHDGLADALHQVRAAFHAEVTGTRARGAARSAEDAEAEFRRSLAGAIRRVVGSPSVGPGEFPEDPCADPFGDLIDASGPRTPLEFAATPPAPTPAPPPQPVQMPVPVPAAPIPGGQPSGPVTAPHAVADGGTGDVGSAGPARTSWWPVNLAAVLSGSHVEDPPSLLARTDKRALFYAGKVNAILGESESGKTWIGLAAVAQELSAGRRCAILDFEDTAAGVTSRLVALGVERDTLVELLDYVNPDEGWSAEVLADMTELLASGDRSLIMLDGVNAAMTLLGLESNSTTDATKFSQVLLERLARTGAGVVVVDHVGKNKETRGKGGIGSQAKRAMIRGSAILAEVAKPFGRGQHGKIRLHVDKDRPGQVREFAQYGRDAGTAVIVSDATSGRVHLTVEPAGPSGDGETQAFRPTGIMDRVSRLLASQAEAMSTAQIEGAVKGKREYVRAALDRLCEARYVEESQGPRGARLYRHITLFRELDELTGDDE